MANTLLAQSFDDPWEDAWNDDDTTVAEPLISGFLEQAVGSRWQDSDTNNDLTLMDSRARLEWDRQLSAWTLTAKGDVYYDGVLKHWRDQLRDLSAQASFGKVDIKAGRQILTWGTGDFLFLNDFFPKDWQSFFAGRQDEYLKAPSDAIKLSYYGSWANINLVWTPEFDADNYINGDYFSFFDRLSQTIAAPAFRADAPNDDEIAIRIYKNMGSSELALYGFEGYFKSPNAINSRGQYTFSGLRSLGASWRRPLGKGLFNTETAYYDSKDDTSGDNPAIGNSQWRLLLAYEQELVARLTGSVQFYLERTLDYAALIRNSPTPELEPEKNRTLLTSRLTWRNRNDKLTLGCFLFYSPSDKDAYVRPTINYRFDDHWQASAGLNVFKGEKTSTFFGQFEDNNNAYARVRYSF